PGAGKPPGRVISHDAVAFERYRSGASDPLLVVTDPRRREGYWSAYRGGAESGLPVRVGEPGLSRPDDLSAAVSDFATFARVDAQVVSAGALGMLAETMFTAGKPFAGPEPLYLRSPDVTVSAGPKRVTS